MKHIKTHYAVNQFARYDILGRLNLNIAAGFTADNCDIVKGA
jgi:hypothetical protein